jgi:iron complex outermembrane receptor protein
LGSVRIFPNPSIQPESGWSSEIGIKQGLLMGKISGQADLALFFSQNSNMIEFPFGPYPDGLGFMADNVEQSRVFGYEAEFVLSRSVGKISSSFGGGYTYIYPVEFNKYTNKSSDIYLKYRRKHSVKLSSNTTYKKFTFGLTLYARSKMLNIDDVFVNKSTRESILPGFYDYWLEKNKGYILLDENIGYSLSKTITISIAAKNITNLEYMGRPGDIQPPRNYSIRLSGKF